MLFFLSIVTIISQKYQTVAGLESLPPNNQVRVVGGYAAQSEEFPWQVWIEGMKYYFSNIGCGGTLVTLQHIITAAHCVQGVLFYQVTLGTADRLTNAGLTTVVPGYRAKAYPAYSSASFHHDIAVITLVKTLTPTDYIHPVKLPELWELGANLDGKDALVSGYGKTRDGEMSSQSTLQFARLRIMNHSLCQKFYKLYFGISIENNQICTTYINRISNVCSGDSGGPLVITGVNGYPTLVGVVSIGVQPCESGAPSVYTAVAAYISWISAIINTETN